MSKEWVWSEEYLKLSGIGSPKLLVEDIKKGQYIPYVSAESRKRNPFLSDKRIPESEIGSYEEVDLFEEDPSLEFAGSMLVVGDFDVEGTKVKKKLENICSTLMEQWNWRQEKTTLQTATIKAFQKPIEPCESIEGFFHLMEQNLQGVIDCLPSHHAEMFDATLLTPAYLAWNSFFLKNSQKPTHENWFTWRTELTEEQNQDFETFCDLFECVQIRSMSEAMAETVGSMMGSHCGKGRCLKPVNFNMEICLRFNLGPLHLLNDFIQDVLKERNKTYLRSSDLKGRLDKVVSTTSAAIHNLRKKESVRPRIPNE